MHGLGQIEDLHACCKFWLAVLNTCLLCELQLSHLRPEASNDWSYVSSIASLNKTARKRCYARECKQASGCQLRS